MPRHPRKKYRIHLRRLLTALRATTVLADLKCPRQLIPAQAFSLLHTEMLGALRLFEREGAWLPLQDDLRLETRRLEMPVRLIRSLLETNFNPIIEVDLPKTESRLRLAFNVRDEPYFGWRATLDPIDWTLY